MRVGGAVVVVVRQARRDRLMRVGGEVVVVVGQARRVWELV